MPTPENESAASPSSAPQSSPASSTVIPSAVICSTPSSFASRRTGAPTTTRHERSTRVSSAPARRSWGAWPVAPQAPRRTAPGIAAGFRKRDSSRNRFAPPPPPGEPPRTAKAIAVKKFFNWSRCRRGRVGAFYLIRLIVPAQPAQAQDQHAGSQGIYGSSRTRDGSGLNRHRLDRGARTATTRSTGRTTAVGMQAGGDDRGGAGGVAGATRSTTRASCCASTSAGAGGSRARVTRARGHARHVEAREALPAADARRLGDRPLERAGGADGRVGDGRGEKLSHR